MAAERVHGGSGLVDVLDRILDKGLVIDVWARVSLVGIELVSVEARVVIAGVDTYLKYADAIGLTRQAARPALEGQPALAGQGGDGQAARPLQGATDQLQGALGQGDQQGAGALPADVSDQLRTLVEQLQAGQAGQGGGGR